MSHGIAFIVGLALGSLVLAGGEQDSPKAPRAKLKGGIDVTAWANSPDDVECSLVVSRVTPKGEEEWGRARCTFFHDGVEHLEMPIAAAKAPSKPPSKENGDAKPEAAPTSVELYRKGDRLAVQHLDGHWSALGIEACEPEVVNDGNSSSARSLSRKLIAAVGGPDLPNPRAGRVRQFAFVKDPRELVRPSFQSDHSSITSAVVMTSSPAEPVEVDLREEVVKHLFGSAAEFSKGRVALTGNADGVVTEVQLQLRRSDNECANPEEPAYWDTRLTFKEVRRAADAKVPADVKKLLDAAPEKPGK